VNATEQWRNAKYLEESAAHVQAFGITDLAAGGQIETGRAQRHHPAKGLLTLAYLIPERVRQLGTAARSPAAAQGALLKFHRHQFLWHAYRQGAQAHGVQHLKDGGVRADSQRERQSRYRRKALVQAELPGAVTPGTLPANDRRV